MRGLSLACLLLLVHSSYSAPQEEGVAATTTTASVIPDTTVAPVESEKPVTEEVIIKYINEINEDGSYTVGFEAADGTFKMETRDVEGNVEGKYGFLNELGEIEVVEYSSNNSTGFTSSSKLPAVPEFNPEQLTNAVEEDPAFVQERARHQAVLDHQKRVVERQREIQAQNELALQRQSFANQQNVGQRRPVFDAANFNPNAPLSQQFDQQGFNQDFNRFAQQQQFAAQQQPQQQFAPRQQQQQFFQQQQLQQQFAHQQQQQFFQQQPQQQLFQQQPEQFRQAQGFQPRAPQQSAAPAFLPQQQQPQQQFAPQRPQLVPVSQLTAEQIALEGFSRDEDQDGQVDPLPAHLLPARVSQPRPVQPQQQQQFFAPQQQQQFFAPQQTNQAQQSFQALQSQQSQFFAQQQQQLAAAQQQQQLFAAQQQRQQQAAVPQFVPRQQATQQQQFFPQQQQQFIPQQPAQARPQFRAPQPVAPTSAFQTQFDQLSALLQQ